jgi:predicted RNA-binding protein YlxR (DUF448 family)
MLASAQESEPDNELDRGPATATAERTCALSREAKPAEELIRFVVGPDNAVVPDVKRKLPGRGLWLTAQRSAVEQAVERQVFARGFKRAVTVPPALADATETLLVRAALDALAMAAKAGNVVAGFAKVEAAVSADEIVALIEAVDAAADGKRKMQGVLHRKTQETAREIPTLTAFSITQFDLGLGRLNVVHAALLAGPVSDTFLARTERLLRYRGTALRAGTHTVGKAK